MEEIRQIRRKTGQGVSDRLLHLALDFGFYRKNEAESGDRNSTQRNARGLTIRKKKNSESQNYTSYSYSSVLSASAAVLDKYSGHS